MTPNEIETEIRQLLNEKEQQFLLRNYPSPSPEDVANLIKLAKEKLGTVLVEDYLNLLKCTDGGGHSVGFFGVNTRKVSILGREIQLLGFVEKNLLLRRRESIDRTEVAYAEGESCVFLPIEGGRWIGRNITTRVVEWRFHNFTQLVRKAYGERNEGGPHGPGGIWDRTG